MTSKTPLAGIAVAAVVATTVGGPAACAGTDAVPQDDVPAGNPIIRDLYTTGPAALVHDGRLYVFTGRDEASTTQADFVMREWHAFSTATPAPDPGAWEHHGQLLSLDDFAWADANAWASEVVRGPDGRFYWFVSTRRADAPPDGDRMSIGVAVADHPLGSSGSRTRPTARTAGSSGRLRGLCSTGTVERGPRSPARTGSGPRCTGTTTRRSTASPPHGSGLSWRPATTQAAWGALRWKVHAPPPAGVEPTRVSTTPGTPPELPERVEIR